MNRSYHTCPDHTDCVIERLDDIREVLAALGTNADYCEIHRSQPPLSGPTPGSLGRGGDGSGRF